MKRTAKRAIRRSSAKPKRRGRVAASSGRDGERLRWAVVGQGHFAQTAILPAFASVRDGNELVALFSDDEAKRTALARRHKVAFALPYSEYDDFLRSGEVQAVYLSVPNHLHRDYAVRAARAGVHVLCEKPMAVSVRECEEMIEACAASRVRLMVAYRLHVDPATLTAISSLRAGRIGDPRYLVSAFSFTIDDDNVRTIGTDQGGGPLYDIGTYCINAARYLFGAEPTEVVAFAGHRPDGPGLARIEEQVSAILRFPEDRLATFVVSFGAADVSKLMVVGTEGTLSLDPGYSHAARTTLTIEGQRGERRTIFPVVDQIAGELDYFAACVRSGRDPEPSGTEGKNDVTVIRAILEAARTGRRVALVLEEKEARPTRRQARAKPPGKGKSSREIKSSHGKGLVHAAPPRT